MNEYQVKAAATFAEGSFEDRILNSVLGLAGEAGEVVDIVKKWKFQGHALEREKLIEEAGDVLFYLANLATALGIDLDEVGRRNNVKLLHRYPNGFDVDRSLHRYELDA